MKLPLTWLAGCALVWLASCSPKDVVVAELPGGQGAAGAGPVGAGAPGNGGSQGGGPGGCSTSADCSDMEVCLKATCGDPVGHCGLRPFSCGNDQAPVCGCDGVTYWNECLRQQRGVESQVPGQCAIGAAPCGGPANGACRSPLSVCAQLLPPGAACGPGPRQGACWVLPDACPTTPGPERWMSCEPSPRCEDMCNAMRTGGVFQRAPNNTCL